MSFSYPLWPYGVMFRCTANLTMVLDPLLGPPKTCSLAGASKLSNALDPLGYSDPQADEDFTPDALPMVIVYRGLGPESGYSWDDAEWMAKEIVKATPELVKKVIFVVPYDYNQDCETCIQQATKLINERNGTISSYSLCGFSQGGTCVYKYVAIRDWKIVGLIDPVPPTTTLDKDGKAHSVLDSVPARNIRYVYNANNWSKSKLLGGIKELRNYLKKRGVDVAAADAANKAGVQHPDMPGLFFKTFGGALDDD